MAYYAIVYSESLSHHGILGQKWGERNGPPYPLDAGDHSTSEKKAGYTKSLSVYNKNGSKNSSSHAVKTALKVGGIVLGAAALGYAAYKISPKIIKAGASEIPSALMNTDVSNIKSFSDHMQKLSTNLTQDEILKKVNPSGYNRNCTNCAVAYDMLKRGYDVSAKDVTKTTAGIMVDPVSGAAIGRNTNFNYLRGIYKDPETKYSYVKMNESFTSPIFESESDSPLSQTLKSLYGDNARGILGVKWYNGTGHALNFEIVNGIVEYPDGQIGKDNMHLSNGSTDFLKEAQDGFALIRSVRTDNLDLLDTAEETLKYMCDFN